MLASNREHNPGRGVRIVQENGNSFCPVRPRTGMQERGDLELVRRPGDDGQPEQRLPAEAFRYGGFIQWITEHTYTANTATALTWEQLQRRDRNRAYWDR